MSFNDVVLVSIGVILILYSQFVAVTVYIYQSYAELIILWNVLFYLVLFVYRGSSYSICVNQWFDSVVGCCYNCCLVDQTIY